MKTILCFMVGTLLFLNFSSSFLYAQNGLDDTAIPAHLIEINSIFGEVTQVDENQISVSFYSQDDGKLKEEIFYRDDKSKLKNITSLKEVPVGYEVEIDYTEKNGKKMIQYLYAYA